MVDTSTTDLQRSHIDLRKSTSITEGRHINLQKSTHRSSKVDTSIFEGRHIDLRRSTHQSPKIGTSIFESRHIDVQRAIHRSSKVEGRNIAPTTQHHTEYFPQWHSIVLYLKYGIISDEDYIYMKMFSPENARFAMHLHFPFTRKRQK